MFRLWVSGCAHVGTDLRFGRESLAEAIRQSEQGGAEGGPPFEWDVALHLGDFSGSQEPPGDEEGAEVVRQLGALRRHRREDVYTLVGNHDASGPDEPPERAQWWFKKWIDPTGEHTATLRRRPRPDALPGGRHLGALRLPGRATSSSW